MQIGIGLPSTIPGVTRPTLLEWSRRAEARGFSSLCAVDRLVYANLDPLIALAAAGAVTERISLSTAVVLAPLRANHASFAKQVASLDAMVGGRLVLGLAVGSRRDDYVQSGVEFSRRGRLLDELLETAVSIWQGKSEIGPPIAHLGGPTLVFGGGSDATFRRAARYGAGWVSGTGGPEVFASGLERLRSAFTEAGRLDPPRSMTLGYFGLGAGADQVAARTLGHYYGYRGEAVVEQIVSSAVLDEQAIRAKVDAFAAAGCDEIILAPTNPDPEQVDRLAEAIGLG